MRTVTRSALACITLAAATLGTSALAGPIVQAGSTYDMRFLGAGISPTISISPITFDGVAQSFSVTVAGVARQVRVTESDTDLGSGQHLITVELTADGDLFPGNSMFASTGNADPFNLLSPVKIDRAVLTMGRVGGADSVFDFTALVGFPNPWNGSAPVPGQAVGFFAVPLDWDTRSIKFELFVSEIPEPGSLALGGLALAAALGLSRRRSADSRS
jgi:PEP-CTERM motif